MKFNYEKFFRTMWEGMKVFVPIAFSFSVVAALMYYFPDLALKGMFVIFIILLIYVIGEIVMTDREVEEAIEKNREVRDKQIMEQRKNENTRNL